MGNISEADQMIASLAENYVREAPLDEEIRGTLRTLQTKYGMSVREIARKTGMNKGVVSAILSLYDIPEIVQKEVAEAPLWTGDSLRKLIDAGEKQGLNREEIAEQAAELIKPNPITGKPLANKAILDELTGLGKQGRNIQEAIQQELARAKSSTYMTISFAIPEDVYNPVYKYSLKKKMTIQEVFLMAINEVMDKITTEIEA
jgi:transcriptional regulator with XRE-family HTH domain